LSAAQQSLQEAYALGKSFGYRNAQATVLAPTGTIGLLMDCDTTGIEPEYALVKWKTLSGGGTVKIVNQTVQKAFARLGYSSESIAKILEYCLKHEGLEGCSEIQPEHLPIFDCAHKNGTGGTRFLSAISHLKMMAAAQPFLSGGISKTVNLPEEATVEDVEKIFLEGWKLGLKAVAIYRDGSKFVQPLETGRSRKG
jgi:ribonucleoside-diphosphate reductase alpha chain